ncbi:CDGSH iron-sulfur domain-containing protein [Halalkalirubrum salinum]|uniref:CDGSH iron-sulfur domain-containing protein n=1 Tax=Halalkalirubrum salinum TaxID=2563889 RepID=UPI0010FAD615|nr:CDGSH iron-sulfur domain-containing protein [Halalkalirubrum salinum]
MSRLVELDGTEPRILDESDLDPEKGDIAVCQCGLSAEFPFCDGSHRATQDEADGVCYRYLAVEADDDRQRRQVDRVHYDDGNDDAGEKEIGETSDGAQ